MLAIEMPKHDDITTCKVTIYLQTAKILADFSEKISFYPKICHIFTVGTGRALSAFCHGLTFALSAICNGLLAYRARPVPTFEERVF